MDRMKAKLLALIMLGVVASGVRADEWSYVPAYAASPSGKVEPTASPNPSPIAEAKLMLVAEGQPKITCSLKTTLPRDMRSPVEALFVATGMMGDKKIESFRYIFGDGESATGSGEMKHVYSGKGTYQVRVTPVVAGDVELPICKTQIVVEAGNEESKEVVKTEIVEATKSAEQLTQPKTGPSSSYWMSLGLLLVVWLGAVQWYRTQRPQIG